MTKMINPGFDPYDEIMRLNHQCQIQSQQLHELSGILKELVKSHNAHAQLIKQITEQNTELLLMWASNHQVNL